MKKPNGLQLTSLHNENGISNRFDSHITPNPKSDAVMNNQFSISFEKINDKNTSSYIIGFNKNEIKYIAIQFMKLQYRKIQNIKFCNKQGAVVVKFINKDNFSLVIEDHTISLSQINIELITSFLLDSTDEYMNYDHIDIEFSAEQIDVCFMLIQ